jgi:anaerobic magnesium-protoporphyrin IX monomethyl ester cyclase
MRALLISPPVSNIGQAAPSISVLAAWLGAHGHECLQWDLGVEAFHHYHQRGYLEQAAGELGEGGEEGSRREHVSALKTVARIDEAKDRLRQPGIENDLEAMSRSLATIRDAGALISAAHPFSRLSYSRFELPGAFSSWESLREAVADGERNLLLGFFRSHAISRIEALSPGLVGISVSYQSQLLPAFSLTHAIKEALPQIHVLLGGSFLKSVQKDLERMPTGVMPADGICIGDGEPTLKAYLDALQEGRRPLAVPNLLLPGADRFTHTGGWRQIDLGQAPVPMMRMQGLDLGSYLVPRYAIPLPVTRGCHWHRCVYCNISNQARETYRSRDAALCVSDMKQLVERSGSDWFDFPTDSVLPRDLERLARALVEQGVKTRWAAEVIPDRRLSDESIELLARSGCCCLRFGLESACPRTLKAMDKAVVGPAEAARILAACRGNGIATGVMLIVGFPTETQADLMQTVEYLRQNADNIDFLTLHQFTVAPGSRLAAQPGLAGVHLLPRQGVLTPSLPYDHTNPVAMRPGDLPRVVETLIDSLEDLFPQCGQLWASGIGGWLTFAAAANNRPEFFKRPLPG